MPAIAQHNGMALYYCCQLGTTFVPWYICISVLEIALRTTGDRSFLIGGLTSAIFHLLGDLSKSDDLDSISIPISILEKKKF